jgi:hypothetical protein
MKVVVVVVAMETIPFSLVLVDEDAEVVEESSSSLLLVPDCSTILVAMVDVTSTVIEEEATSLDAVGD